MTPSDTSLASLKTQYVELVMRQRDEELQRRGARASFTGDMRSSTGCSGHIGHFMASAATGAYNRALFAAT
jgi:hypothetical protein